MLKQFVLLYLHCYLTSHDLKVLMDAVFGPALFRNEIIWKRTNARSTPDRWPRVHDVILFYSKQDSFKFNTLRVAADKAKLPHTLITGPSGLKYQTYELTAPGVTEEGDSGKPCDINPTAFGRHWANNTAIMDEWDKAGLIHWPKPGTAGGFPRRRDEQEFDPEAR